MHFEHRLFFAPEELLDAVELWQGLTTLIEHPQEFVLGLSGCDILERGPSHVLRRLHFGHDSYRDRVEWEEGKRLRFVVEPQDGRPVAEWLSQAYAAADADTIARIVAIARKKRGKA